MLRKTKRFPPTAGRTRRQAWFVFPSIVPSNSNWREGSPRERSKHTNERSGELATLATNEARGRGRITRLRGAADMHRAGKRPDLWPAANADIRACASAAKSRDQPEDGRANSPRSSVCR